MTGCVVGPGLVGSFLGAVGGFTTVVCGPRGRPRAQRAWFQGREYVWTPKPATAPSEPTLVACRRPDTPSNLPPNSLLAQNGLDHPLPVVSCFVACDLDGTGRVCATGDCARLVLATPAVAWQPIIARWRAAGMVVEVVPPVQAQAAVWEKAILNASLGPLCLLYQKPMRAVWASAPERARCQAITAEGVAIAQAAGHLVDPHIWAKAQTFFAYIGDHQPSIVRDMRELESLFIPLLYHARRYQIACPQLNWLAEALAVKAPQGSLPS